MVTDVHGCSTCPPGGEHWEVFRPSWADGERVQYDYRHTDGSLYSVIAISLTAARRMRDLWLASKEGLNAAH